MRGIEHSKYCTDVKGAPHHNMILIYTKSGIWSLQQKVKLQN